MKRHSEDYQMNYLTKFELHIDINSVYVLCKEFFKKLMWEESKEGEMPGEA